MLRQAFQLAHFIQGDGEFAARIATSAVSKLSVAVSAQDKRLYYRPGGRTWLPGAKRVKPGTKVFLSEAHLLQRLVYIESEVYERQNEQSLSDAINEESLITHFIKHLVMITLMRNSFHVTLGVSRLLFNYTTAGSMEIYNVVVQDPDRVKDDAYWRERKARLMRELSERFGKFLVVARGQHGEERFQACEDSARHLGLVMRCLEMFVPWNTTCPLPAGADVLNDELAELTSGDADRERERAAEVARIHAVIHPVCFGRLATGLRLASPAERLEIPRFFHSTDNDREDKPGGDRPQMMEPNEGELERMRGEIDDESARRKKISPSRLRILVDGDERAALEPGVADQVSIEVEEGEQLIEVRTAREDGDLPLAVHALSYDDLRPIADPTHLSITCEGGQKISFTISPPRRSEGASAMRVSVEVSYEEALSRRAAARAWQRSRFFLAELWRPQRRRADAVPRYALAVILIATSALSLALFLIYRERTSERPLIALRQDPSPATEAEPSISPNPTPPPVTASPGGQPAGPITPRPSATAPPVNARPRVLRGEATPASASLPEVKKIYIELIGDRPSGQSIRERLGRELAATGRWTTATPDEADAALKVSVDSDGDGVTVWLVGEDGRVIWPRAGNGKGQRYEGGAEKVSAKIVADLLGEVRQLDGRRQGP